MLAGRSSDRPKTEIMAFGRMSFVQKSALVVVLCLGVIDPSQGRPMAGEKDAVKNDRPVIGNLKL